MSCSLATAEVGSNHMDDKVYLPDAYVCRVRPNE